MIEAVLLPRERRLPAEERRQCRMFYFEENFYGKKVYILEKKINSQNYIGTLFKALELIARS